LLAEAPDVILHHAKILTVEKGFSTADAIAISGNKIVAVGNNGHANSSRRVVYP
jgi:predicted amidohydrolase YtcJ